MPSAQPENLLISEYLAAAAAVQTLAHELASTLDTGARPTASELAKHDAANDRLREARKRLALL